MQKLRELLYLGVFLCVTGGAYAQMRIEVITGTNTSPPALSASDFPCNYASASPGNLKSVVVLPFQNEAGGRQISQVIAADLARSGQFKLIDTAGAKPQYEADQVDYAAWRSRGADAVVLGSVIPGADGRFEVRFRLMDATQQTQIAGLAYGAATPQLRLTAHKISDVVYEKLTGEAGVFATRIAYVMRRAGRRFELHVADADGYAPQSILASNEPIISPTWSPDGGRLAYVSFENKKPVVYVQNLANGTRKAVANFFGSNSAPAWSPDGRRLAVVLSRDGGSQMFVINADGNGQPTRLTASSSIDTEPTFSPDGSSIMFTSDRGGSPQIYRMPASGGPVQRVSFEGQYNVSPRFSPDGRNIAYVHRCSGRFTIATQDIATRQTQVLTTGAADESPTYSPNGRMILHASQVSGRGILAAVSSDGRVKQRFTEDAGDIREPAWGPLVNK